MAIERVQSSEFNRLRHGQSIGCNGLVLNPMVCDRLFGTFGNCVNDGRRQFCLQSKNEHGDPHFFLSQFQEKCIRKVLAVFENILCSTVFFAATVWFCEPLDLQLKHIQKPPKN